MWRMLVGWVVVLLVSEANGQEWYSLEPPQEYYARRSAEALDRISWDLFLLRREEGLGYSGMYLLPARPNLCQLKKQAQLQARINQALARKAREAEKRAANRERLAKAR